MIKLNLHKRNFFLVFFACTGFSFAQNIGINQTGAVPHSSALLDLNTGNTFTSPNGKGLMLPNVALSSTSDATTINSPLTSLLVYNTATAGPPVAAVIPGFYYWNGIRWIPLSGSTTNWTLTGNGGTNAATNFIGTTDNVTLNFRVNNQRAGRISHLIIGETFIGYLAGSSNTTGTKNSAYGYRALGANTNAGNNTAFGFGTLQNNTSATSNIAIGSEALLTQSFSNGGVAWATNNIAIGTMALYNNQPVTTTSGVENIAIGHSSLLSNTTGTSNMAIGNRSLTSNTTGNTNIAIGRLAMEDNTIGGRNIALGDNALANNTSASQNIAIGYSALSAQSYNGGPVYSTNNVAIGYLAMVVNQPTNATNGRANVAVGSGAMNNNTQGYNNVGIGLNALSQNTTGTNNSALGYQAHWQNNAGGNNTAIGHSALATNNGGNNNTALGYLADVTAAGFSNATAIGYNAKAGAGNTLILGGAGTDTVNVGIGLSVPVSRLEVNGAFATTVRTLTADAALDNTAAVWYASPAGPITLTLPGAPGVTNRRYIIVNASAQVLTISAYSDLTGAVVTTIPFNSSIEIISDGINWLRIR